MSKPFTKKTPGQLTQQKLHWIRQTKLWIETKPIVSKEEKAWLPWAKNRLFELTQTDDYSHLL